MSDDERQRQAARASLPATGIVRRAAGNDYRFSSLVLGIVESTPFQMRRTQ